MSKGKVIVITLSVLLIIGGGILFSPSKTVLAVSNRKNPKQRIYSAQAVKDGFVISYTHSVNKGRIHDYYECEEPENNLVLKSMHFVSYGAGIPEPDEYPGASFIALEDCYIISNINRVIPSLVMAVGVIAEHSFAINNSDSSEIFLTEYFAPQTSLIIKIEKVSIAEYLAHKID